MKDVCKTEDALAWKYEPVTVKTIEMISVYNEGNINSWWKISKNNRAVADR